jgi:glycosyltransferase involved in cell wall biosynthesis
MREGAAGGREGGGAPDVSVVIVSRNTGELLRACLESLEAAGGALAMEVIVVDNGSTDGTPEFLRECQDVRLIANSENRGFPAAANQGIQAASGENLLLLNNDTIVTTGWLRRMLEALHDSEEIGLVGPVSNNVSGPQQQPVTYSQLAELDGFAWEWAIGDDLAGVLWPVAHSATGLLTSVPLGRVKGCAGCNWLFVDESKNKSRRWCSMEDCGTYAKMRRYVARRAAKRKS